MFLFLKLNSNVIKYKEMVQQYRSAVHNEFKAVFKHYPYKLDGDKEKARDLLKKDEFLYLQVPADPEANQSEQIFMNANFLAVATAFAKMPSVTRSLTVSKFLELKSFHVLACIMCFVRHQLELVIVNKSNLSSVCQSAKKYYRFMNIYNYVGDDESSLCQRGFLQTGCSRFYARMDILLNDYSGEDSDDGKIQG
ncbi:hypothetical protein BDR26DRAFT_975109 [Obelidium mucronatum]|nr:hypothetical protein BDR26DRAFT_975109 [Obelidium mucronatum]